MSTIASEFGSKSPLDNEHGEGSSTLIDLESKVMQVGTQKYYIDMKESNRSRFFKIVEVLPRYKRSRLVVPMTAASQFCEKLQEMDKFASNYDSVKHQKDSRNGDFIHSLALTTSGRRKYYFDLSDTGQFLDLKISYVYGERRDDVHMVTDAIVEILNILDGFIQRFPPLPGQEEEDANFRPPPRRNYVGGARRGFDGAPRGGRQTNGRQIREGSGPRRRNPQLNQPLVVLEDPAPSVINLNQKEYTFEMVEGSNVFIRITETINGIKKSTLHVPAEACKEFRDLLDRFTRSAKITDHVPQTPPQPISN